jgi:aspartyl-tRNA(Asn)/glutamyl-tRNA(Gln) amidotransferase subunit B
MRWEITIGLEVHAQIQSKAKLFSSAPTAFGAAPNTQLALLDVAFPGMLPVVNKECVEQAVRAALGLGCDVHLVSRFDRKNYFYPDLPQGYQISQFEHPIATGGAVELDLSETAHRTINLERLHIEQDAGKNIHIEGGVKSKSYVDLNRAGIGLMEIVSKPEMHTAEEAQEYVRKLRAILRYLNVCDGNMEQGSLRADVNVSVAKKGDPLGTRCEIKNLNSIKSIGQAVNYEAQRQIELIEQGEAIGQETRLFDALSGTTRTMRSKEDAHDYRYFPDPDLPMLVLEQKRIDAIKATLPELPDVKKKRIQELYALSAYDASVLIVEQTRADYFEETAKLLEAKGIAPKLAANWVLGDLISTLNKSETPIEESPVAPEALATLIMRIAEGTISGKQAKEVFKEMAQTRKGPDEIIEAKGLQQLSDSSAIESVCDSIIGQNQDKVAQLDTKPKMFGWFVGEAMKATQGKANPQMVNKILRAKLKL